MPSSSSFRNRARSLTVGHPPWNELTFCGLGARGGGPDGPQRTFCELLWRTDLRIAAPKSPKSPRMRQTLAVQARNPKRPRRAPPPILDETALGRSGEESALHGACSRFRFALQTPIYTRCAPAATPHPSQARSEERGARSEERGGRSEERGGPGRSGRCAGCVAGSSSHWQCQFRRPVALPQAPALPRRRLRVCTLWSP